MHDHHLHLFAAAAALASVPCGPPDTLDAASLARVLRAAPADPRGWVRGVGYCESVAGALDRRGLDALRDDVPVRVQHRSGQLWILGSRALEALGLGARPDGPPGIERDAAGRPTGRLYRLDAWLRRRLGPATLPDLAPLARRFTQLGVEVVTDATPGNGPEVLAALGASRARGELPQRVVLMGTLALGGCVPPPGIEIGPLKLHLAESALPPLARAAAAIDAAHAQGRAAAVHCATRTELLFALAAFEEAGVRPGDRLEHVHVAPPEAVGAIARLGLTVCANPALVAARRARWEREVEACDRPWIAPYAALRAAGVPLLWGSDAPFGPLAAPEPVGV